MTMQAGLAKIADDAVAAFLGRIRDSLHIEISEVSVTPSGHQPHWSTYGEWASKLGVYLFLDERDFLYVGRALRGTRLGKRVWSYCKLDRYKEDSNWGKIIRDPGVKIRLYAFDSENFDYWVAALELFLMNALKPIHNGKRG